MKLRWLIGALGVAALVGTGPVARAADHLDGPAVQADKTTDITDTYAWMEGGKLVLVMNVHPLADGTSKFSDAALYVFHVNSAAGYLMPQTETTIICSFATDQTITCWPGDDEAEIVTGDASGTAGLASASGKFKVFAGHREDPFFFNLVGFNAVRTAVLGALAMNPLPFTIDENGCPELPKSLSDTLVTQLTQDMAGGAGVDFFLNLNVLSIIVEVDPSLVNDGGPILGYWASTNAL
jgi:hypothetical protein